MDAVPSAPEQARQEGDVSQMPWPPAAHELLPHSLGAWVPVSAGREGQATLGFPWPVRSRPEPAAGIGMWPEKPPLSLSACSVTQGHHCFSKVGTEGCFLTRRFWP